MRRRRDPPALGCSSRRGFFGLKATTGTSLAGSRVPEPSLRPPPPPHPHPAPPPPLPPPRAPVLQYCLAEGCDVCASDLTGCLRCSYGYYRVGRRCLQCAEGCLEGHCNADGTCSKCKSTWGLVGGTCQKVRGAAVAGRRPACPGGLSSAEAALRLFASFQPPSVRQLRKTVPPPRRPPPPPLCCSALTPTARCAGAPASGAHALARALLPACSRDRPSFTVLAPSLPAPLQHLDPPSPAVLCCRTATEASMLARSACPTGGSFTGTAPART